MKLENWKDAAELIALFAVVASLIAIVFELRQTQNALEAAAYQERAFDAISQNYSTLANDDLIELTIAFQTCVKPIESLSDVERRKLTLFYIATRADLDNEHFQFERGFLEPDFYYGQTATRIAFEAPMWRLFLGSEESRPSFKEEVDRILEEN